MHRDHLASAPTPTTTGSDALRRRSVLAGGALSALALTAPLEAVARAAPGTEEAADSSSDAAELESLEELRTRWRDLLTGGEVPTEDGRVTAALQRQDEAAEAALEGFSPTAPLWEDIPFGSDAANVSMALSRLRTIALAWATPGCRRHADPRTGTDLARALQVVSEDGYHPGRAPAGNWWFWEIGVPNHLTDLGVLLHDVLPEELLLDLMDAIAHFAPDPNFRGRGTSLRETGANRVDKSLRCALRGILRLDPADVALARDALSDVDGGGSRSVFGYVTSGDGFYEDGSFIQHGRLPYVGTYGTVALSGISRVLPLLAGSPWEVTDPAQSVIHDAIERSVAPFVWQGVMMDTVRGRAVSRQSDSGSRNALSAAHSALLLAQGATGALREQLLGRAIGWITTMPLDIAEVASVAEISRFIAAENTGADLLHDEPGLAVFADQERFVHRREDWAFTVSTSSSRIGRYEWGNRENATGWYQGDGASFLQLASDPQQTDLHYWPTVDPYRLPGTTVEMSPRESGLADGTGIPRASADWAGGTSVLDSYGAWSMDHVDHDGALTGRLSWFLLEDMVVTLGAGITSTTAAEVETSVENRALRHGTPVLRADGETVAAGTDEDGTVLEDPSWVHLEGVGGYVMLAPQRVRVRRRVRHGAWEDINQGSDTGGDSEVHAVTYGEVAVLHGTAPSNSSYAVALAPTASVRTTRRMAEQAAEGSGVQVVANERDVQSVSVRLRPGTLRLGNAFTAASIPWLRTDGPASVALVERPRSLDLSVSEPSRSVSEVTVTLPGLSAAAVESSDDAVTTLSLDPVTLRIATGGSRGASHRITLAR
ncbi:polysaccharide lyase 8 family protein [Brachybacterium sp. YJGR34]|uniref:polysaccharide lyase 8 family protein n=1 Tax=Brachybacterium sp. YJGR34 TaxID=2059911 RepID=UPI000E0CA567|nr:polysaccharide lyase 8 family protein [Brachybacterium sp. YJGR34]